MIQDPILPCERVRVHRADRRVGRLRVLSRRLEATAGAREEREQAEAARTALSRYGETLRLLVD